MSKIEIIRPVLSTSVNIINEMVQWTLADPYEAKADGLYFEPLVIPRFTDAVIDPNYHVDLDRIELLDNILDHRSSEIQRSVLPNFGFAPGYITEKLESAEDKDSDEIEIDLFLSLRRDARFSKMVPKKVVRHLEAYDFDAVNSNTQVQLSSPSVKLRAGIEDYKLFGSEYLNELSSTLARSIGTVGLSRLTFGTSI